MAASLPQIGARCLPMTENSVKQPLEFTGFPACYQQTPTGLSGVFRALGPIVGWLL
jgi:hypothetical protein